MKKLFLALTLLALASCGTPRKAPDDNANNPTGGGDSGGADSHSLTGDQLRDQCGKLNGFVTSDGSLCLLSTIVTIPDGQPVGRVQITPNAQAGRYLVTIGTNGAVIVVWNGQQIGGANSRIPINVAGGPIMFQILNPNASKTTAILYECRDQNMRFVYCPAGEIPAS
jgi:hypothetical protein